MFIVRVAFNATLGRGYATFSTAARFGNLIVTQP